MHKRYFTNTVLATSLFLLVFSLAADDPKPLVKVLPNGLTVVVNENHTAPVAALRMYVKAGSIHEQEYLGAGISHVFEHMIHGGTTTNRSEKKIRDLLDHLGGHSNAYTQRGHTGYYITTPREKIGLAIELMADWMANCTFEQKEFDREIPVILEELHKGREEPRRVLYQAFMETVFRKHPVRHPIIGYEPQVKALTRDDIVKYYKRKYVPNNMIVVVAGDFDAGKLMQTVQQAFGGLKRKPLPPVVLPREPRQLGRRQRIVESDKVKTAYFRLGYRSVTIDHPDLYALDVLSYILSHGRSSRLVRSVVEKQRLADRVFSYSDTPEYDAGLFVIGGRGNPKDVDQAVTAVVAEVRRLQAGLVSQEELAKAKQQKAANQVIYNQTVEDEADSLGINMLMTGNADFDRLYLANIRQVTAEQVRSVARRYLVDDQLSVVIMRPPDQTATAAEHPREQRAAGIRRVTLPNGLRLLVKRNPNIPLVNMQAYFLGGRRWESADQAGISSIVGALLTRGTATRSGDEIAAAFDRLGGRIRGTAGNNTIGLGCEVLKEDFDAALTIFADILQNASFPKEEFAKVQKRRLNAIAGKDDDWQGQLYHRFRQEFFGKHPYATTALGRKETIAAMTAADVRQCYRQRLVPARGVVAVFGDINEKEVLTRLRTALGDFKRPAPPAPAAAPRPARRQAVTQTVPTKRGISAVTIGYPGARYTDLDGRYSLMVLDAVLQTRLYEALRGNRNLVYLVYSTSFTGLDPGYFAITAAATPKNMPEVLSVIAAEVEKVRRQPVAAEELQKARSMCINAEILGNQTNGDMALRAVLDELYGLGCNHHLEFRRRVHAVTAEDLQRAAGQYLVRPLTVQLQGKPAE